MTKIIIINNKQFKQNMKRYIISTLVATLLVVSVTAAQGGNIKMRLAQVSAGIDEEVLQIAVPAPCIECQPCVFSVVDPTCLLAALPG